MFHKKTIALAASLLMSSIAFSAQAADGSASCAGMTVVQQGTPLNPYSHQNQWWIEGQSQAEYQIELHNYCGQRVLAVVSVDGLNVLDGKTASIQQGGYVLEPMQRTNISGWRKSWDNVASFYFTYPQDSYGAQTGRPKHLGVIGAAFFYEKERVMPRFESMPSAPMASRNSLGASADSSVQEMAKASPSLGAAPTPSLGTGHGRLQDERAVRTTFDRQPIPFETTSIRYDTRDNLIRRGIIPRPSGPQAFPGDSFTPDPPRPRPRF